MVSVEAAGARSCNENEFAQRTGMNMSSESGDFEVGRELLNIIFRRRRPCGRRGAGGYGCPLGDFVVLFLYGTSSLHNSVFIAARKIKRSGRENAMGLLYRHNDEMDASAERRLMLLICCAHMAGEAVTILYYVDALRQRCPGEITADMKVLLSFVLLPMALHFW